MAHTTTLVTGLNNGHEVVWSLCNDCGWQTMPYSASVQDSAVEAGMYHWSEMNSTPEQLAAVAERETQRICAGNYADGTHRIGGFDA